jgi:potassium-transporting ATPase KdpC subunit
MIKYLKQSIVLTVITILIFGVGFPMLIWGFGQLMPNKSEGSPIIENGRVMGFENVGQNFTDDKYFNGRPSAVNYNAAATGGSNLGPTNPDYLATVQARIDTFLVHNPGINKKDIPSDLVTASGSGIDPNISVQGAMIQIPRISKERNISPEKLTQLVKDNTQKPVLGFFGVEVVNVLKLNLALDKVK